MEASVQTVMYLMLCYILTSPTNTPGRPSAQPSFYAIHGRLERSMINGYACLLTCHIKRMLSLC